MINGSLKSSVLSWLDSLKIGGYAGRYRVCRNGNDSLSTSCAALFTRELLGDIENIRADERLGWIDFIRAHQDADSGYFHDDSFEKGKTDNFWGRDYLVEQTTKFSLMALSALGANPAYELKFMQKYSAPDSVIDSLKILNWKEPWYQSNIVMYKLCFLIYDYEKNNNPRSLAIANAILDWLDSWQDPQTGLWCTNRGNSKYHGVFTAFHFILFYFYLKKSVQYVPRLIDSCLDIQNKIDGLFSPHGGGGACPDLDAVDILVKCGTTTDYRATEVRTALEKTLSGLLNNQNIDGGFCWASSLPFTPLEWMKSIGNMTNSISRSRGLFSETSDLFKTHFLSKGYYIKYTGRGDLGYYSKESDVFSTWFRVLTLALIDSSRIDKYFKDVEWKFPVMAGIGWHNKDY